MLQPGWGDILPVSCQAYFQLLDILFNVAWDQTVCSSVYFTIETNDV